MFQPTIFVSFKPEFSGKEKSEVKEFLKLKNDIKELPSFLHIYNFLPLTSNNIVCCATILYLLIPYQRISQFEGRLVQSYILISIMPPLKVCWFPIYSLISKQTPPKLANIKKNPSTTFLLVLQTQTFHITLYL